MGQRLNLAYFLKLFFSGLYCPIMRDSYITSFFQVIFLGAILPGNDGLKNICSIDKLLIDTDVILDFFFDREPFAEKATRIFSLCE